MGTQRRKGAKEQRSKGRDHPNGLLCFFATLRALESLRGRLTRWRVVLVLTRIGSADPFTVLTVTSVIFVNLCCRVGR